MLPLRGQKTNPRDDQIQQNVDIYIYVYMSMNIEWILYWAVWIYLKMFGFIKLHSPPPVKYSHCKDMDQYSAHRQHEFEAIWTCLKFNHGKNTVRTFRRGKISTNSKVWNFLCKKMLKVIRPCKELTRMGKKKRTGFKTCQYIEKQDKRAFS